MFIVVHFLKSYNTNCTNRDQSGSPKSVIIGGTLRDRESSQSQKSAVRKFLEKDGVYSSKRSKRFGEKLATDIVEKQSCITAQLASFVVNEIFGINQDPKKAALTYLTDINMSDAINAICNLSSDEISTLEKFASGGGSAENESESESDDVESDSKKAKGKKPKVDKKVVSEAKSIISILKLKIRDKGAVDIKGLLVATGGRMSASNTEFNLEAAVSWSHSFTTHKSNRDSDFFSAMDDFSLNSSNGAAYIADAEQNGGSCFYKNFVIDVEQLKRNLSNPSSDLLRNVIADYIQAALTVDPTGKQKTLFAQTNLSAVFFKITDGAPHSLASAFDCAIGEDSFDSQDGNRGYAAPSIEVLARALHEDTTEVDFESSVNLGYVKKTTGANVAYSSITLVDTLPELVKQVVANV
jgi:CRISPR system Cascade subunit CasC